MARDLNSCIICSGPLSAGSVNGVCPVCVRTNPILGEAAETLRPAATIGAAAHVHSTTEGPDPLPPNPPGLMLIRRLGTGGMGIVYLGVDTATRRFVAVKMLHAAGERGSRDRFQSEVRVLAELNHPHIVTVFSANLHDHAPYYTMEFVPGGTLARFVFTHGPVAPTAAAALVATIARAAHAANERGIVHRDIKPGNVLLGSGEGPMIRDGTGAEPDTDLGADSSSDIDPASFCPKLSDFGLAKRTDRNEGLTLGDGAIGTPGFLAPEQATGSPVSPRTDVYGLGATLYHALTGRAPFEGENARAVVAQVESSEPDRVRLLRPEVSEELEAIVHKCLEKNPAARYASAEELAADLDRFAAGEPVLAKPLTPLRRAVRAVARKRRRIAGFALVALLLVAAAVGGAFLARPRPEPDPLKQMQRELVAGKEVTLLGATGKPDWSAWVQGASGFAPADGRDEACAFQAMDLSMLDLCPDTKTDSYRIRAELCQLNVLGRAQDGGLPTGGEYEVGLYFGRQAALGKDGWRSEVAFLVRFTEAPHLNGSTRSEVRLERVSVPRSETVPLRMVRARQAAIPFEQSAILPGPWRGIEVQVTPDGVKVWWTQPDGTPTPFAEMPADLVGRVYVQPQSALDQIAPKHGIVIPQWNPRAPLGVWSYRSAVAVRNVTLTPLK
jgi:eukaryotic-like serine/threonine-protein kinase